MGSVAGTELASILSADAQAHSPISAAILANIFDYASNKFDDTVHRLAAGTPKFLSVIDGFVMSGEPVEMCLPAFPFKSANKVYKVFGILPDKAEELALDRLNTMCVRIGDIYAPGAKVLIISDGLVYNGMYLRTQHRPDFFSQDLFTDQEPHSHDIDLLCIPDRDTWAYGEALRTMALHKGFDHITFSRLQDLVQFPLPRGQLNEITYVANATNFRRYLLNKYGNDDIDVDHEIATNTDTRLTYCGYKRFLESDLKYIFPRGKDRTSNGYKRDVKFLAKEMLIRGYVSFLSMHCCRRRILTR